MAESTINPKVVFPKTNKSNEEIYVPIIITTDYLNEQYCNIRDVLMKYICSLNKYNASELIYSTTYLSTNINEELNIIRDRLDKDCVDKDDYIRELFDSNVYIYNKAQELFDEKKYLF